MFNKRHSNTTVNVNKTFNWHTKFPFVSLLSGQLSKCFIFVSRFGKFDIYHEVWAWFNIKHLNYEMLRPVIFIRCHILTCSAKGLVMRDLYVYKHSMVVENKLQGLDYVFVHLRKHLMFLCNVVKTGPNICTSNKYVSNKYLCTLDLLLKVQVITWRNKYCTIYATHIPEVTFCS